MIICFRYHIQLILQIYSISKLNLTLPLLCMNIEEVVIKLLNETLIENGDETIYLTTRLQEPNPDVTRKQKCRRNGNLQYTRIGN